MEGQASRRGESKPEDMDDRRFEDESGYMARDTLNTPKPNTRSRTKAQRDRDSITEDREEPPYLPLVGIMRDLMAQQSVRDREHQLSVLRQGERDQEARQDRFEEKAREARLREEREAMAREDRRTYLEQMADLINRPPPAHRAVVVDDGGGGAVRDDERRVRREEREEVRVQKAIQALPKWSDGDDLPSFFRRLETLLEADTIPRNQWVMCISRVMGGKVAAYIGGTIPQEAFENFNTLKDSILTYMGLTADHYTKIVFGQQWVQGLSESEIFDKSLQGVRKLQGGGTLAEREFQLAKAVTLDKLVPEVTSYVNRDPPINGHQLVQKMREFRAMNSGFIKKSTRTPQPDPPRYSRPTPAPWRHPQGHSNYAGGHGGGAENSTQVPSTGRQGGEPSARFQGTCHNCGIFGHRAYECRKPLRAVKKEVIRCLQGSTPKVVSDLAVSPVKGDSMNTFQGSVEGAQTMIRVDSGADRTLVSQDLVPRHLWLEETVTLTGWSAPTQVCPLAKVTLSLGPWKEQQVVALAPTGTLESAGVYLSLSITSNAFSQIQEWIKQLQNPEVGVPPEGGEVNAVTRAQAAQNRLLAEQVRQEERETAVVPKNPTAIQVTPVIQQEAAPSEVAAEVEGEGGAESEEEEEVEGEMKRPELIVQRAEESIQQGRKEQWDDLVVPIVSQGEEGKRELEIQTRCDPSLAQWRAKADQSLEGFHWEDQLLLIATVDSIGDAQSILVIPQKYRDQVLRLAHDLHGHLSPKKVKSLLKYKVAWPNMASDIGRWCLGCLPCQTGKKGRTRVAPMEEVPIVSEPWEKVACDVVGPFPQSRKGFRYLLTVIDLATRFPEAIPLKNVTATDIAEALLGVFTSHGVPRQLLSDQGSNLTGLVMQQLCVRLGVDKIQTTPYRPQSNGVVERFHGTLVPMLLKSLKKQADWPLQVKFCLYAIRAAPNRSTGYSPFQLLYGREMRAPVDLWLDSRREADSRPLKVSNWVEKLCSRLDQMKEVARANGLLARTAAKVQHDRKAVEREVVVGSQILLRLPGMTGKLDSAWAGPYTVLQKMGKVTIQIQLVGPGSKRKRVVHVNLTKPFIPCRSQIRRVMVVAEDAEEEEPHERMGESAITTEEQVELQQLLQKYQVVFTDAPGNTTAAIHQIATGDHPPVRSAPYGISAVKAEGVRAEVEELSRLGIIVPSVSPWASPVVPVVKPTGEIRLCVDYRKVNAITLPDPYAMPLVEALIYKAGAATHLSKIDLAKGFYQVPLDPRDQEKTAFITPGGKYHFTRMPFGLCNAPSTFQRLMDVVLSGLQHSAVPYMDDILIFSEGWAAHHKHIEVVLQRLARYGLTAKPAKCAWARKTLEYLGHVVGDGKVQVPECRVQAIKNYVRPTTQKQMKSFLGLTGYYRRFIRNYAAIALPLQKACLPESPQRVNWNKVCVQSFHLLCSVLCSVCSLHIPTLQDTFVLQTDASYAGLGACLAICRGGEELPTAFYSRQLKAAELNYSATEIECLAVVEAITHFEILLDGVSFILQTDHRALEHLLSAKFSNRRLSRWALRLQGFRFSIRYRPGRLNGNADALSRQSETGEEEDGQRQGTAVSWGGGDVGLTPPEPQVHPPGSSPTPTTGGAGAATHQDQDL